MNNNFISEQRSKPNILKIVLISVALLITQQGIARISGMVANAFSYGTIDPDGLFAWISVHHIVQLALGLLILWILGKSLDLDFGLKIGDRKRGMKSIALFAAFMTVYVAVGYTIKLSGGEISNDFALNARNVIGTLGFQLLLSGPSEEILFRALTITMLVYASGQKTAKNGRLRLTYQCVVAAALFSIAHINWTLMPPTISVDIMQLFYAFGLGLLYGMVYQQTGSVLYPIIMHSISNVWMVGAGYILSSVF